MTRPLTVTAVGNAQLSTGQSKFGGSSILLDGTGDYLNINSTSELAYGTGDFCMETWIYKTGGTSYHTIFDMRTSGSDGGGIILGINNVNQIYMYYNFGYRVTTAAISNNTWTHIALARVSGETRVFINGTQSGSTYTDSNNYAQRGIHIGADPLGNYAFPGYMDEIRISKGAGRYSTTFTPSTTRFWNDNSTSVLIHGDSAYGIGDDAYDQTDNDQLYIVDGYFDGDDYFVYIAEAAATPAGTFTQAATATRIRGVDTSLASTASISVTANRIRGADCAMAATATTTATISHIEGADLFAFTTAQLTAQAEVIRDNNISLNSQVTFVATVSRIITFDSAEAATATISVDYVRYRTVDAAVSAAFSLAAVAERSAGLSSALASTASQSITVDRIRLFASSLASTANLTITAGITTEFWFNNLTTSVPYPTDLVEYPITDSSGNVYSFGQIYNSSHVFDKGYIRKTDKYSNTIWEKTWPSYIRSLIVLADDTVVFTTGTSTYGIVKINSSGSIIWQKSTSTNFELELLGDGNLYSKGNLTKIDSSTPSITWSKNITTTTLGGLIVEGIDTDSSGNIFVLGYNQWTVSGNNFWTTRVFKINSTATTILSSLTGTSQAYTRTPDSIGIDSQDNIYFIETIFTSGSARSVFLRKFNSSFTHQWSKSFTSANGIRNLIIDQDDSLFLISGDSTIIHLDSDANIIWQKKYQLNSNDLYINHLEIDTQRKGLHFTAWRIVGSDFVDQGIFKIPLNGSGVADSPLSITTTSVTYSSGTWTSSTPSGNSISNRSGVTIDSSTSNTFSDTSYSWTTYPIYDVGFIQSVTANLTSSATLNVTASKNIALSANLTSSATVFTETTKSIVGSASLDCTATITAQLTTIKENSAALAATGFAVTVNGRIRAETANLDAAATLTADIARTRDSSAALAATASLTANTDSQTVPASATLNSTSTLTAQGNVFAGNQIAMQVDGFIVTVNARIRAELADLNSAFTLAAQGDVGKIASAALAASTTLTADVTSQTVPATAALASTATLTAQVDKYAGNQIAMASTSAITANNLRIRYADSQLATAATLSVDIARTRTTAVALAAAASVSTSATNIKQFEAQLVANAGELVIVNKIGRTLIDLATTANLTAQAVTIQGQQANLTTTANLVVTTTVNKPNSAVLNTTASLTAEVIIGLILAPTVISAQATLTAQAKRSASLAADLLVNSQLTAGTSEITQLTGSLFNTCSLTLVATRIKPLASSLTAQSQLTALGGKQATLQANLSCQGFILTTGSILHIIDDLTYVIPNESRTYQILYEDRSWLIDEESRTYIIKGH